MARDETKTERVEMRVSSTFLTTIDEWRRRQPEIPSRSEAIRTLAEIGIEAERRPKKKG